MTTKMKGYTFGRLKLKADVSSLIHFLDTANNAEKKYIRSYVFYSVLMNKVVESLYTMLSRS